MREYVVIPLGEILKDYNESKIAEAFKEFSCSRDADLENFLQNKAIAYQRTNFGKSYLCIDKKELDNGHFKIMAYFTLAQRPMNISNLSKTKKRKVLGDYPGRDGLDMVPAYLIGQLGRCDDYSNSDLSGEQILNECYHAISLAARVVGGNMIILECREHMYEKFYEGQGFKKLYNELSEEKLYMLYKKIDFSEYWDT